MGNSGLKTTKDYAGLCAYTYASKRIQGDCRLTSTLRGLGFEDGQQQSSLAENQALASYYADAKLSGAAQFHPSCNVVAGMRNTG